MKKNGFVSSKVVVCCYDTFENCAPNDTVQIEINLNILANPIKSFWTIYNIRIMSVPLFSCRKCWSFKFNFCFNVSYMVLYCEFYQTKHIKHNNQWKCKHIKWSNWDYEIFNNLKTKISIKLLYSIENGNNVTRDFAKRTDKIIVIFESLRVLQPVFKNQKTKFLNLLCHLDCLAPTKFVTQALFPRFTSNRLVCLFVCLFIRLVCLSAFFNFNNSFSCLFVCGVWVLLLSCPPHCVF